MEEQRWEESEKRKAEERTQTGRKVTQHGVSNVLWLRRVEK
jgi:hypothetical protein